MEEIDLSELLDFFKSKFAILLAIVAGVCALGSIYSLNFVKPEYIAETTIVLSAATSHEGTITQSDISLNNSLIGTYSEVVESRRVLDQVAAKLKIDGLGYDQLASKITTTSESAASIIRISVSDEDAARATDIANTTAYYFAQEVVKLYKIDNVSVLDPAIMPEKPSNLNFAKSLLMYFMVGAVLAVGIVFMLFYFDPTIKNSEDVERRTEYPILGRIHNSRRVQTGRELVVQEEPKAIVSENIRTIRTNLLLSMNDRSQRIFLVTSSTPGEGKSFVSSNLAATLAQNGKSVLLIDADMRRGRQHEVFHMKADVGLAELLQSDVTLEAVRSSIKRTKIPRLYVLTRGKTPRNPSELLDRNMYELITKIQNRFDYIVVDGAPIQGLPDTLSITNCVDATILVCADHFTNMKALMDTKKNLDRVDANVVGIVYNRDQSSAHSYSDKYYQDYYDTTEK